MASEGEAVGLIHTLSVGLRNANDVVTHYRVSVWLIEGSEGVFGHRSGF